MRKRYFCIAIALCLLASTLIGCGAASKSNDMGYATDMAYMEESSIASYEAGYGYSPYSVTEMAEEDIGEMEVISALNDAKLVYTARMEMETTEFDSAVADIKERVEKAGGYVEYSSLSNYGAYRYISYTLRLPSEQYRYFCDTAGEIGNIRSFSENVENISDTYYNTESRLESAKAKLATLQDLLKQAEDMEDIISIQYAISDCQYEIDYLSGNLRRYDSLVSYSTINISLQEVSKLSNTEEPAIGFGQRLGQAFKKGFTSFGNGIENAIIGFANHFIGWMLFITAVVICIVLVKRWQKKKKKRVEEHYKQQAPQQSQN